jgi:hypothetical protein
MGDIRFLYQQLNYVTEWQFQQHETHLSGRNPAELRRTQLSCDQTEMLARLTQRALLRGVLPPR